LGQCFDLIKEDLKLAAMVVRRFSIGWASHFVDIRGWRRKSHRRR
jgi:hypothetical protein